MPHLTFLYKIKQNASFYFFVYIIQKINNNILIFYKILLCKRVEDAWENRADQIHWDEVENVCIN